MVTTCFKVGLPGSFPAINAGLRGLDLSGRGFKDAMSTLLLLLRLLLRLLCADEDDDALLDEGSCFSMIMLGSK